MPSTSASHAPLKRILPRQRVRASRVRPRSFPALLLAICALWAGVCSPSFADESHATGQQLWQLDPGFGNGGIVKTDFPHGNDHFSWAYASLVQPDGRIVAGGVSYDFGAETDVAAIARYLPNGDLDPSFGDGGRVMLGPHGIYTVTAMALQTIGGEPKIVLAVQTTFRNPLRYRCSVIRLNPDGSLDTNHDGDPSIAFGDEGIKVIRFAHNSGFCYDMTLGPTGKIVGVIQANGHRGDVGVFRLRAIDGSLDPTFGGNGKVIVVSGGFQDGVAVTLQPFSGESPRVVVGGLVSRIAGYDWALWRLTPDGKLDPTFGKDGRVVTPMRDPQVQQSFDTIDRLTVTPDRKIVAVGRYRAWPQDQRYPQDTAAVAEYLPDGQLDTTFGDGGRAHLPWDGAGETEALDVTLDSAGRILFAGPFSAPTYGEFLIGGLMPDGTPDVRFGPTGYLEIVVGGGYDEAHSLSLDHAGRLVVAGVAGEPGQGVHDQFGVLRLRLSAAGR